MLSHHPLKANLALRVCYHEMWLVSVRAFLRVELHLQQQCCLMKQSVDTKMLTSCYWHGWTITYSIMNTDIQLWEQCRQTGLAVGLWRSFWHTVFSKFHRIVCGLSFYSGIMFLLPSNNVFIGREWWSLFWSWCWHMEGHNLVGGACFVAVTQWTEGSASCNHFNSLFHLHVGYSVVWQLQL